MKHCLLTGWVPFELSGSLSWVLSGFAAVLQAILHCCLSQDSGAAFEEWVPEQASKMGSFFLSWETPSLLSIVDLEVLAGSWSSGGRGEDPCAPGWWLRSQCSRFHGGCLVLACLVSYLCSQNQNAVFMVYPGGNDFLDNPATPGMMQS